MSTPDLSSAVWRKSSRSNDNGGDCVEIGLPPLTWRKSSRSGDNGGNCVEVAAAPEWAAIRDSKSPASGTLTLSSTQWTAFRRTLKSGELDLS
jgi:hypothetical protein